MQTVWVIRYNVPQWTNKAYLPLFFNTSERATEMAGLMKLTGYTGVELQQRPALENKQELLNWRTL